MPGSAMPPGPAGARESERSFRDYILSRRFGSGRSRADSWRFVIRAMGEEELLVVAGWPALKRKMADAPAAELAAARTVWRSYERWRDERDHPFRRPRRRAC